MRIIINKSRTILRGCSTIMSVIPKTQEEVKRLWKSADCVCFDVDSTVNKEEGIDELAKFLNRWDEVARIAKLAMQGGESYRTSLQRRLDIIKPTKTNLDRFIKEHTSTLTPGVDRLVRALQNKGVAVYLLSGGFTSIIAPVASQLGIPQEHIYANELVFDAEGSYAGFNTSCPTSDDNGKAVVVKQLRDKHGYKVMVHVGDGATDADACPPADAFIGFGGNQVREDVRRRTAWFVTDFDELTAQL